MSSRTDTRSALSGFDQRILVLAPSGIDAEVIHRVLVGAGLRSHVCPDAMDLMTELGSGAGAAIVADEALGLGEAARLAAFVSAQPAWSDLPLILLTRPRQELGQLIAQLTAGGHAHLTVFERPIGPSALLAAAHTVLRARMRQYQVRDELVRRTKAEAALREADARKDDFIAMLAHELRNPLAPIRTATRVLELLGPKEPRLVEARAIIERQAAHMTRIVDDLLDASRVIRGKIGLQMERLRVGAVIAQAIETARPLLDAAEHTLTVGHVPDVWIEGDAVRLVQVVANLLGNAAKFTPHGGHITLGVSVEDARVSISVQDTGVGISEGAQERIFELFQQENVALDRAQGGLGIGLTLAKQLVAMHGGTVRVHSELGKGSRFVVTLPCVDPTPGSAGHEAGTAGHGATGALRVLVVEDNPDESSSLHVLLELHGYEVRLARDGVEALRISDAFAPDVALIDIGLPGIDGYGVAERIRATGGRQPFLVAHTGYGTPEDKRRARDAGFDAHMVKPVDPDDLVKRIEESLAAKK
jgi:signal transduction histidine kinase